MLMFHWILVARGIQMVRLPMPRILSPCRQMVATGLKYSVTLAPRMANFGGPPIRAQRGRWCCRPIAGFVPLRQRMANGSSQVRAFALANFPAVFIPQAIQGKPGRQIAFRIYPGMPLFLRLMATNWQQRRGPAESLPRRIQGRIGI